MSDQEIIPTAEKAKKPRATKKKAAEAAEVTPEVVAVEAPAKPAGKPAAKKAKPVTAEDILEAPVKPKRATKPKKGRDLVVDEPGAVEVTEVLHSAEEAQESPETQDSALTPAFKAAEPKLERLQKILAKAGISSRRKAEELIQGGQVQINGKIVTELGTKADPERDHIRVDGKLLQGPERLRYFVLNKPKGYVTTVSDPEGRPTVMQFFSSERERLYPVGRLDYLSEGLLLVTNDGELANKLTKAASGVEKTYLVKVAGQPTEDMIDVLRAGVVIEKGRPGTFQGRVRTAPAKIRQVREGDNPWYEVIIIEGRNRELRKMFEEIGHHVEKIRRIGYGPLVLDQEPGQLRELEAEEVRDLHLTAEGKLKTRRRRGPAPAQLPTVAGKTVRYKKADGKPGFEPRRPVVRPAVRPEFQVESAADPRPEFKRIPKKEFHDGDKPAFKARPKPEFRAQGKADFKGDFKPRPKPSFKSEGKPAFRPESKPAFRSESRPESRSESRPAARFDRGDRPSFKSGPKSGPKPGFKSAARPAFGDRPTAPPRARRPEPPVTDIVLPPRKPRPEADEPAQGAFNPDYKPGFRASERPSGGRPAFRKDGSPKRFGDSERPRAGSRGGSRQERHPFPLAADDDYVPTKTPGFKIEPVADAPRDNTRSRGPREGGRNFDRPRPSGPRPTGPRPGGSRPPAGDRPFRPRPQGAEGSSNRPAFNRNAGRPAGGPRSFGDRPRPAAGGDRSDRPFRPSAPKKFAGAKPTGAGAGPKKPSASRTGPDGEPRVKERWRNSFTGKNKGRPKPKPKAE